MLAKMLIKIGQLIDNYFYNYNLFLLKIFVYRVFFSESVDNLVLNKMNHQKFQSDENDRFFISKII